MNIVIINSAEPNIHEFAEPIRQILEKQQITATIIPYKNCLSTHFDRYDGIIISGSPQGDDIVEHHQPYFQWIKTNKIPVLGICAGHHITGYLYGAEYLRSIEPESGLHTIRILEDNPLFDGLPSTLQVEQMHNDSITLPRQFIHLAQSTTCFNQAMCHKSKPLYTLQFHPENHNPEIILNFLSICKKHQSQQEKPGKYS